MIHHLTFINATDYIRKPGNSIANQYGKINNNGRPQATPRYIILVILYLPQSEKYTLVAITLLNYFFELFLAPVTVNHNQNSFFSSSISSYGKHSAEPSLSSRYFTIFPANSIPCRLCRTPPSSFCTVSPTFLADHT